MKTCIIFATFCILIQKSLQIALQPKLRLTEAKTNYKCNEKESIRLKCPFDYQSSLNNDLITIKWFKDSIIRIQPEEYYRHIIEDNYLVIRNVLAEDAGLYTCQITNGYGTSKFNITLKVNSNGKKFNKQKKVDIDIESEFLKPVFIEQTPLSESGVIIRKSKGSEIKLSCFVESDSDVDIIWFKDGKVLSEEDYGITRSKWSIDLKDLRLYDSGNFSCQVFNDFGTINKTFQLFVYDDTQINEGIEPLNSTIDKKQDAHLICRLRSDNFPKIEWLKQISKDEYKNYVLDNEPKKEEKQVKNNNNNENSFLNSFFTQSPSSDSIEFDGTHYITISSSNENTYFDPLLNVWINELIIKNVTDKDSGVYLCFGATSNGFSYKKARLNVAIQNQEHFQVISYLDFKRILLNSSSIFIILIPILFMSLFVCIFVYYLKRLGNNYQSKNSKNSCLNKLFLVASKRCCVNSFLTLNFDSVSDTSTTHTTSTTYYSPVENKTQTKIQSLRQSNEYKCVNLFETPETPSKESLVYYKVLEFNDIDEKCDAKSAVSSSSRFYYQVNSSDMDSRLDLNNVINC